ncbi:MAG: GDYXXLXY domain-containing protein [Synergistaceae bacterium]|nr:GDYXXLXY domain-containing protein [Synergistaceae bacterium]
MRTARYLLAAVLPLCVLLWLPAWPALISTFGDEVRLAARPVDPRDLFRGDYVSLTFEAAAMPLASFDLPPSGPVRVPRPTEGDVFYVSLEKDASGLHVPVMATPAPPDGPWLRARVVDPWGPWVHLDLGPSLKRFYVREGTGLELERADRLVVTVRIWRGEAVIASVEAVP